MLTLSSQWSMASRLVGAYTESYWEVKMEIPVITGSCWQSELIPSSMWLRDFRFGPLDLLWRSPTYWSEQLMRTGMSTAERRRPKIEADTEFCFHFVDSAGADRTGPVSCDPGIRGDSRERRGSAQIRASQRYGP